MGFSHKCAWIVTGTPCLEMEETESPEQGNYGHRREKT